MTADPWELERARDCLRRLVDLHEAAEARITGMPRIGEESWSGRAYGFYSFRVDRLVDQCRDVAGEFAHAVEVARREVLDAG